MHKRQFQCIGKKGDLERSDSLLAAGILVGWRCRGQKNKGNREVAEGHSLLSSWEGAGSA